MYILMFSLLAQDMPFENFNLIGNILMLTIFNTYVSHLVDAVELNIQNSPSSRHLFCILKIPDTEYLF